MDRAVRNNNIPREDRLDLGKNNFSPTLNQIRENKLTESGDDRATIPKSSIYIEREIPETQKHNDCVLVAVEIITNGKISRDTLKERLQQQQTQDVNTHGTCTNTVLKIVNDLGFNAEFIPMDEKSITENLSADNPIYVVYKSESGVGRFSAYASNIEEKLLTKSLQDNPASNQEGIKGHAAVIIGIESFPQASPVVVMMDGYGITRMSLETLQTLHKEAARFDTEAPWSSSERPIAMVLKQKSAP